MAAAAAEDGVEIALAPAGDSKDVRAPPAPSALGSHVAESNTDNGPGTLEAIRQVLVIPLQHAAWAATVTVRWLDAAVPVPVDMMYELSRSRVLVLCGLIQLLLAFIGDLFVDVGTCAAGLTGIPNSSVVTSPGTAAMLKQLAAPVEALRWTFAATTLLAASRWHSPWWLGAGIVVSLAYFVLLTTQDVRFCFELASLPNQALTDIVQATTDLVSALLSVPPSEAPDVPLNYALPAGLVVFVRLLEWLAVAFACMRMLIKAWSVVAVGCLRARCCGLLAHYSAAEVQACDAANPDEEVEADMLLDSSSDASAAAAGPGAAASVAAPPAEATGTAVAPPPTGSAADAAGPRAVVRVAGPDTKPEDKVAWPIAAGARGRDRWPVVRPQLLRALDNVLQFGRRGRASWPLCDRLWWFWGMLGLVPLRHWIAVVGAAIVYCCIMTWTAAVLNTLHASGKEVYDSVGELATLVPGEIDPDQRAAAIAKYAQTWLRAGMLAVDSAVIAQAIVFGIGLLLLAGSVFTVACDSLNLLLVDDDIRARWDPAWHPHCARVGSELRRGDNLLAHAKAAPGKAEGKPAVRRVKAVVVGALSSALHAAGGVAVGSSGGGGGGGGGGGAAARGVVLFSAAVSTPTSVAASTAAVLLSPATRPDALAAASTFTLDGPPSAVGDAHAPALTSAAAGAGPSAGDDASRSHGPASPGAVAWQYDQPGSSAPVACGSGIFCCCAPRSTLDAPYADGDANEHSHETHASVSTSSAASDAAAAGVADAAKAEAVESTMPNEGERGERWYIRGSDPEDPILDLHAFEQTAAFTYVGQLILSTMCSMGVLSVLLTVFIWTVRYAPARAAFLAALGAMAVTVLTRVAVKCVSGYAFIDAHNNLRAPRIFMAMDAVFTLSFGVMFGGAAGVFRVLVGCVFSLCNGMQLSRPLVRFAWGVRADFGFGSYGGMLKSRFAWLLEQGPGPVRHISPM